MLKIEDSVYYSKDQAGLITEITDDKLIIQSRLDYLRSKPLTITNIGDTYGTVALWGKYQAANGHYIYWYPFTGTLYITRYSKSGVKQQDTYKKGSKTSANGFDVFEMGLNPGDYVTIECSYSQNNSLCNSIYYYYNCNINPYLSFELTGSKFKASGNLMSLESAQYNSLSSYTQKDGLFHNLFENCDNLVDIKDLYCPIVGDCCYWETFKQSGVENLPVFEEQRSSAYALEWVFYQCNNLTDLSDYILPAEEYGLSGEECCYGMFEGCINLEKSPIINKIDSPSSAFKQLFKDCYKLKEITQYNSLVSNYYRWVDGVASNGILYVLDEESKQSFKNSGCGYNTYPCSWEIKTIN